MKSRIPIVLTEGGFSVQLEPITGENDSEVCKKGLAMEKENLGSGHAMTGNHESASKSAFAKSRGNHDMQLQNRKQKMAIIHVAKNQLGLDEDDYREILYSATKG